MEEKIVLVCAANHSLVILNLSKDDGATFQKSRASINEVFPLAIALLQRKTIMIGNPPPFFFMDFTVNYVSILVAAFTACFIGFMWHGPVFGKQWVKLMGITPAQMAKGQKEMASKMPIYLFGSFVQQIVTAFVVSMLANVVGVQNAMGAVMLAFWLWLGLIATTLFNGVLWEERKVSLYLFNITYQLVSLVVMTLIVGVWL